MSFHNRFLSLGLIIAAAKTANDYIEFEMFMTKAEAYTFIDKEAFAIHQIFINHKKIRRDVWIILGTQDFSDKKVSLSIKGLTKAWFILDNPSNEARHKETIKNYMELVKKCEPKYSILLKEIVDSITSIQ